MNYEEFNKALQIESVRLKKLNTLLKNPYAEGRMNVDTDLDTEYEFEDGRLVATVSMKFRFKDVKSHRINAKVEIVFEAEYKCLEEPDEKTWEIFSHTSLLLHVWPYVRLWLQNITSAFGWVPFVLPLYKVLPGKEESN